MKYLGIDYGSKRIGLAVSDGDGVIAFPRMMLTNDDSALGEIAKVVEEERIERVVVGDTHSLGGAVNPVTADADAFIAHLKSSLSVPVESAFEGWSSIEASRYSDGEKRDDSAAAIILQRYLDMHGGGIKE